MKYDLCPRCALSPDELVRSNGKWLRYLDEQEQYYCGNECGIYLAIQPSYEYITLYMGDYLINWYSDRNIIHQYSKGRHVAMTTITYDNILPFNVTVEQIKLALVFS